MLVHQGVAMVFRWPGPFIEIDGFLTEVKKTKGDFPWRFGILWRFGICLMAIYGIFNGYIMSYISMAMLNNQIVIYVHFYLVYLSVCLFHPSIHSSIHPCMHAFMHSCRHSFVRSLIHSVTHHPSFLHTYIMIATISLCTYI